MEPLRRSDSVPAYLARVLVPAGATYSSLTSCFFVAVTFVRPVANAVMEPPMQNVNADGSFSEGTIGKLFEKTPRERW